jgi:hypothetical protein
LEAVLGEAMTQDERKTLAQAAAPLEVLCAQIRNKPFKELTEELQEHLLQSMLKIRTLLFESKHD